MFPGRLRVNRTIVQLPIGALEGGFNQFTNLGIGLFTSGVNTISFDILNVADRSPLAPRLEASVTASPTPEPAFASVAAIVGSLILLWRRKTA